MTAQPPTLAQQIEAVAWAVDILAAQERVWPHGLRDDAVKEMLHRLVAAIETLKTMAFARETLG